MSNLFPDSRPLGEIQADGTGPIRPLQSDPTGPARDNSQFIAWQQRNSAERQQRVAETLKRWTGGRKPAG